VMLVEALDTPTVCGVVFRRQIGQSRQGCDALKSGVQVEQPLRGANYKSLLWLLTALFLASSCTATWASIHHGPFQDFYVGSVGERNEARDGSSDLSSQDRSHHLESLEDEESISTQSI
jgi:hypothetical protein